MPGGIKIIIHHSRGAAFLCSHGPNFRVWGFFKAETLPQGYSLFDYCFLAVCSISVVLKEGSSFSFPPVERMAVAPTGITSCEQSHPVSCLKEVETPLAHKLMGVRSLL